MESSALKRAFDRWQHTRGPQPELREAGDAPLGLILGLPPEIVEEYATLASRVERALAGASRKAIVVGSPTRKTGNSTVAVGLAATLAVSSKAQTLLVDANLRQPSLHAKFQLPREPGLTDLVRGRAQADEVLVPTAVPQLTLIPSGTADSNPQSFFQTREFQQYLSSWTSNFAFVILDTAPFTAVAEPLTLAQSTSGVVFVVQATRTVREVAAEVVDDLRVGGVHVLGAVLNRRKLYIPEWIYKRV